MEIAVFEVEFGEFLVVNNVISVTDRAQFLVEWLVGGFGALDLVEVDNVVVLLVLLHVFLRLIR